MPASRYDIVLNVDRAFSRKVPRRRLTTLARRALAKQEVAAPAQLSIVVTDDSTMRDLNRRFRDKDVATDVLSFGIDASDAFVTPPDSPDLIGEVVISFPTAERQAREQGRDVVEELEHLLLHGCLHLLGFDHEAAADARVMRAREEALLGRAVH